jgi:predicted protein tyrosine phosphatase
VVCVFARKTSEPLASLVKQIDEKIGENRGLCSFVVIMSKQPGEIPDELRKLARDNGIKKVPLTMFGDPGGPGEYELSPKADITVLMWKGHRVKVNHAFKGELTDNNIRTIVADIPKVLGE